MDERPDLEFDKDFCSALNDGTMHCDALNELAWSIMDYSLDERSL